MVNTPDFDSGGPRSNRGRVANFKSSYSPTGRWQCVKGAYSAGSNPARSTNFMIQPIFVIKKSKVKEIVEHQSKFTQIPYHLEWGHLNSIEELFEKLDNEKTESGYIRMHQVHNCINSFETHKIPAYANRMLDRVLHLCKLYREDLNKISVEH
jgi:hypothetical protein